MEKGQIFEITIEDMSSEGQGIGRAEGLVVFVPGTVVGDRVKVCLTKVKKKYAFSRLVKMLEPSVDRTEEFDCEFIEGGCGGCPYGKLSYEAQIRIKECQVREKLQRLAGLEQPQVRQIIAMEESDNEGLGPFRYRNKAQFPVSTGGIITRKGGIVENLGEPVVGFYRAKSHEVVNCTDCYLQSMAAMAAADALRRFMVEDNITAWDPKWEKGLIRHLIVKTAFTTKEVMVIIVISGKGIPNAQKLIEMLDEAIYEVGYFLESVVVSVKKGDGQGNKSKTKGSAAAFNVAAARGAYKEILGSDNTVIAGKPVIKDIVGELEFEISPASFYQVNPVQMKRLYDKVREYCGFGDADANVETADSADANTANAMTAATLEEKQNDKPVILDLYCGVGTIGLYCADQAKDIIGIESVKNAVLDANRNAVINGIVNAKYICGRAEEELPKYAAEGKRADIAILDPPRAGCRPELLEAVAEVGVKRIVYVSCDPATLARDIKLLAEIGYEFREATPVDMFPWTGHVESVVLMSRVQK